MEVSLAEAASAEAKERQTQQAEDRLAAAVRGHLRRQVKAIAAHVERSPTELQEHGSKGDPGYGRLHPGTTKPGLEDVGDRVAKAGTPSMFTGGGDAQFDDFVSTWEEISGQSIKGPPDTITRIDMPAQYGEPPSTTVFLHGEKGVVAGVGLAHPHRGQPGYVGSVQVRPSERGKGRGTELYDHIQDHTDLNLYDYIGNSQSFTPAGKAFAEKWLEHRVDVEVERLVGG